MRKKEMKQDDNRKVVIYARKSKITHKGDSISNQEEYCKEYARLHLMLPEDYEFGIYEDEGKSGFYADRPDFQRMIRDVEHRKIKAIVCYKLDRISRRMSDLTNLIDYLNKYDVALLISSNNLNTMDSNSKMMVQMLGMIAEFERDIIAERLQDNLTELAKDGRWLGGITPTGYSAERSKYGSGKKKNAFTYLVTVPEEKALVEYIFSTFLSLRGLHATAVKLNAEGYTTKNGSSFTTLAVKDIIRNPVYCIANKTAYQYFLDKGSNVFGDIEEFDGVHGISVYNRTLQTKEESDDSTFLHPDFTASTKQKEPEEWIVAVGKHEGFIDSERWIEAQKLKEDIAEKYNQPHRSTNALLSGIMYCPECGSRLRVVSESNRYTHGKPRFKYSCPKAVRKGNCNYVAVHGVEMDEFIVDYLSKLKENEKDDYKAKLRAEIKRVYQSDSNEKEIRVIAKEIEKLERSIKAQVKALRTATAATRPYIQSDIDDMANEIAQKKQEQARLEEVSADSDVQIKEIEKTLTMIDHFNEISEKDEPGEVISAIQSILERVYVIREDGKEKVKIFIKGAPKENYDSFFEEGVKATIGVDAMCDLDRNREYYSYLCWNTIKE
ncbi:MAG: recombinase family protein [Pseudobutyrivibrio sp.]|nr:recombinase family protein [Pseudobutyrivibrio sp.]